MLDSNTQEMARTRGRPGCSRRSVKVLRDILRKAAQWAPDLRLHGQTPPWKLQRTNPSLELSGHGTLQLLALSLGITGVYLE